MTHEQLLEIFHLTFTLMRLFNIEEIKKYLLLHTWIDIGRYLMIHIWKWGDHYVQKKNLRKCTVIIKPTFISHNDINTHGCRNYKLEDNSIGTTEGDKVEQRAE